MKKIKQFIALSVLVFSASLSAEEILRLSTTTSTENSGLLAVLNPIFEKKYAARLDVIAVGTGKALKLGENGDVDVIFVHAPQAEITFVDAGFGINRQAVMHNDFVIVGAKSDTAQLKHATTIAEAFTKINQQAVTFISRGDDSGTHKKEKLLWKSVNIEPQGEWYIASGQGMGSVLKMADEKQAYTLSDRGTYISYQDKIDLSIVFEGDKNLFNPYHIMAVNPEKHPHVNVMLAKKYIEFVISEEGQTIIGNYKKAGQQLFYPDAVQR